jgi:deoxyribodipyrimidine photolyase-related protein
VGTKPYASTGRYIARMSNACKSCPFDPTHRTGDESCPFTVFYWDFLLCHHKRFAANPRMRMMMKNLERIDEDERQAIRARAGTLRREFGITPGGG